MSDFSADRARLVYTHGKAESAFIIMLYDLFPPPQESATNTVIRTHLIGLAVSLVGMGVNAQTVKLCAAACYTAPKTVDRTVPPATHRTLALQNTPAHTSQ